MEKMSLAARVRALKRMALRSYSHPNQEEQLILLRNELVRESDAIAADLERIAGEMRRPSHHDCACCRQADDWLKARATELADPPKEER